jgi:hypothetical protein
MYPCAERPVSFAILAIRVRSAEGNFNVVVEAIA